MKTYVSSLARSNFSAESRYVHAAVVYHNYLSMSILQNIENDPLL
jgi:hypothetical protein